MSFESSRSIGRAGTLLTVATTIIAPIIVVVAFFLGLLQNIFLFVAVFSVLSYFGQVLFLVAMNRFASYYQSRAIFRDALYGFITQIVGSVVSLVLTFWTFSYFRDFLERTPRTPSGAPSISFAFAFIAFFLVIWLGVLVIALVQAFFYRRAFYALAEKSGENNFRQAGFFMLLGAALTIIVIGGLIFFVGWIFAVLGFFSMRPTSSQPVPSKRFCPNCGSENTQDAIFCSHCGNML